MYQIAAAESLATPYERASSGCGNDDSFLVSTHVPIATIRLRWLVTFPMTVK